MNSSGLEKLKENYWLHFALLLAVVFLLCGKPVPYSNEYVYLLRLIKPFHADFLLNDFIYSKPANEHWLFDHIFGFFTLFVRVEVIAWIGRIACWTLLLAGLLRLGKLWKIPLWLVSGSVFLWLCLGQSMVADEWMIGVFEAKGPAYICLLFALDGFAREQLFYPSALLGLSFSLHPAVGLWAIPAAVLAVALVRFDLVKLIKIAAIGGLFSLPGLIPLFSSQITNDQNTTENWKYFELVIFPYHFDPFSWARSSLVLMILIGVFCLMFYLKNKADERQKFLTAFLLILFLFFISGLFLRALGQYELLRFMPMRLYSVIGPLFFLFALAAAYRQKVFAPPVTPLSALGLICLLGWTSPLATGFFNLQNTVKEWRTPRDDAAETFIWIRENTPNGTVVLAPPWRRDFWYLSRRAQVVSFVHTPVADLNEWRARLRELVGRHPPEEGEIEKKDMADFYNQLTTDEILESTRKYGADYFISQTVYPFPIAFQSGKFKVYRMTPEG
ncbi:MAG: DUF6798 domain-containing protein [Pyrinomonadaceae bacterium]